MKKKIIVMVVALLLVVIMIGGGVFYKVRLAPCYAGVYSIEDYQLDGWVYYQTNTPYKEIKDYKGAYNRAYSVMKSELTIMNVSWFDPSYKRDVYYDARSETYLVYIHPSDIDVLDGGYLCIVRKDGSIVNCWRG